VAYLSRIFLYPIKSLDGVSIDSAPVLHCGALADDRRFALFDPLGQYVNGKRNPRVHLLRSSFDPVTQTLQLAACEYETPVSFSVTTQRHQLESWLSEFFAFPVTFRENATAGFPDDTDSPGPTLVSTGTLREIANWFGLTLEQTRARFRTNLEVDGVPPFWEDQLYGQKGVTVRFKIGDVIFDGINPCQRCVVPARDPATGMSLPEFAKRFVELRKKFLPDWAEESRFNHYYRLAINTRIVSPGPGQILKTGDPVTILGPVGAPLSPAAPAPTRWSGRLRLAQIIQTTANVRTFRFASLDGSELPFTHLPGQYLNIELVIDGQLHRRCYTIASAPTCRDYCELTIKREDLGAVSRYLHDQIQIGAEIQASGPGGKFTFTGDEADSILLIGAGVGITPLMSVIRHLTDQKWPGQIHLLYSVKTRHDIIFSDELADLTLTFPNLRITTTLTQEQNGHWPGLRGRITPQVLGRSLQDLPNTPNRRINICGPMEMSDQITKMLHSAGVPPDQIRSEAFGGPAAKPSSSTATIDDETEPVIGAVTFAESAKSVPLRRNQTLIDAAARVGIPIDRGCLAGICGRCKVRLVSGSVNMDVDDALTDCDKSNGYVLACQAKPVGNVAVDA
jgi:ferredoxin-NADP reductase/uncharacterized protein YcbX